jgi:hypothetical protein
MEGQGGEEAQVVADPKKTKNSLFIIIDYNYL